MVDNNYQEGAKFVSLVHNWHVATDTSDVCGLTEATRHEYNVFHTFSLMYDIQMYRCTA